MKAKMKLIHHLLAAVVVLLAGLAPAQAQSTNQPVSEEQLMTLKKDVETKISLGKNTEADYAAELKRFDQLIAIAAPGKSSAAPILMHLKAQLLWQVLNQPEKGLAVFQCISEEYPDTPSGKNAARMIAPLSHVVAVKKIQDSLAIGSAFPDFNEQDFNGQPLSVGAHKGKVVLVDFWATWCVPCQIEMPNVVAAYNQHHADGFEVIGITLDVKREQLASFLKKNSQLAWPEYFDDEIIKQADKYDAQELPYHSKLAQRYGINKVPSNFLIGRDGKIIGKDLRGKELLKAVADAVTKK